MSTPVEQIAAEGAAAEAQARARDAADAAAADAAMNGAVPETPATPLTQNAPATRPGTNVTQTNRPQSRPRIDDPGTLHTDDFGLDGDLEVVMKRALEEAFDLDDEGKPNPKPDDQPADTAATPDPASTSGPASPSAAPEDGAGVGGAAAGAASGAPAAPDPGAAPPAGSPAASPDFDLNEYARSYFGTDLDRETSARLFAVLGGIQNASPEQRREIDAILMGRGMPQVAPITDPAATPQQVATDDYIVQTLGPRPDDEYLAVQYDLTARGLRAQHQQMSALEANIAQTTQAQLAQQQQQLGARIDAAESSWRTDHPILSDGEFDALRQRIITSGTFPALMNAHHGDPDAATRAAFDQMFWSDETLRARAMANAASGRDPLTAAPDAANPASQAQTQTEEGRRALAASLAGGGGHAPIRNAPAPKTAAERKSAMVAEIGAAMEDST